ncbi:MAG TPA: TorF family putative porin [Burkholderiales bacterium]|jgi:uncharacterized protein (TIGR02001 family)
MRKTILAASLATVALALPGLALAQAAAPAPAAAPPPPYTFTGNMALVSDYRFRGITQTFAKPALQGGFDFSHSSGFYAGNWDSAVNSGAGFPGGNLEMDFYGGWKNTWGDWGLDVGDIYYYYPGTHASATIPDSPANNRTGNIANGKVHNNEIYVAGSWKWISLKYSHATSDYFSTPNTKGSNYLDLSANYDLGDGWGVNGHVGHLDFKNMTNGSYTDWKVGVTKDLGGWVLGASYIDTNAKGSCSASAVNQVYCFNNGSFNTPSGLPDKTRNAGSGTVVLSVSKTF